jgi:hypothetical protein
MDGKIRQANDSIFYSPPRKKPENYVLWGKNWAEMAAKSRVLGEI